VFDGELFGAKSLSELRCCGAGASIATEGVETLKNISNLRLIVAVKDAIDNVINL
jgi:hypothetical protein